MSIRPHRAPTMFLTLDMMHEAQDRLEEEQNKHDNTDDRMIVVQQIVRNVVHHPHAQPKRDNVHNVREELEYAMHEPDAAKGTETDQDGAHGEEEHEGEGGEDAVRDEYLLARVDEGLRGAAATRAIGAAVIVGVSAWSVATEVTAAPAVAKLC